MVARRGMSTYSYETVLGSIGFSSGKHYWEVTLDVFGCPEDVFIGVCKSNIKLNKHACESADSTYGW